MNIKELDIFLLNLINQPFSIYLNIFFLLIVFSAYAYVFLLFFILYKKKRISESLHLLITSFAGFIIVTALKYLTNVARPELSPLLVRIDPSFPSRHSFVSGLSVYFSNKIFKGWLKVLSIFYLILIPIGSVYVGVHYPSDVVVGFLIGLILPKLFTEKSSLKIWKIGNRFISKLKPFKQPKPLKLSPF